MGRFFRRGGWLLKKGEGVLKNPLEVLKEFDPLPPTLSVPLTLVRFRTSYKHPNPEKSKHVKSHVVRGLLGTGPLEPTLESASPSPRQGSSWHRNRVKSGNRCRIDAKSTPQEGKARAIRGWGPGPECLIKPSQK